MKQLLSFWYIWAFIGLVLLYEVFRPLIKGRLGIKPVATLLSKLDPSKYEVINNMMINVNGQTTQIDHVVISNYGIFVIETKNNTGRIFGNEFQEYWTQTTHKNKVNIANPVRENYRHIQALRETTGKYPALKYFSIIVFTRKPYLNVIVKSAEVIHMIDLLDTIKQHSHRIVSNERRNEVYKLLSLA